MPSPILRALAFAFVLAAGALSACSSDDHPPAASGGGGTTGGGGGGGSSSSSGATAVDSGTSSGSSDDAGSDSGADAGGPALCTDQIELSGSALQQRTQKGNPPDPYGGVIVDGTYVLADRALYNQTTNGDLVGVERRVTVVVKGNVIQRRVAEGSSDVTTAATFTVSDTKLVLNGICPTPPASPTWMFSSQAPSFVLYLDANQLEVYTQE